MVVWKTCVSSPTTFISEILQPFVFPDSPQVPGSACEKQGFPPFSFWGRPYLHSQGGPVLRVLEHNPNTWGCGGWRVTVTNAAPDFTLCFSPSSPLSWSSAGLSHISSVTVEVGGWPWRWWWLVATLLLADLNIEPHLRPQLPDAQKQKGPPTCLLLRAE